MKQEQLLGMQISVGSYHSFVDQVIQRAHKGTSEYVCVANVHMLIETRKSKEFARVVNHASIVTPDGKPLTWALRMLKGIKQDRVAGMDLLPDLLKKAALENLPVYFYGGQQSMLDATDIFLRQHYPGLLIAGMESPPFKPLSPAEIDTTVQKINDSSAAIVLVVLGCPKQEKWMAAMKGRVNAVMIGVGGALPVMIGLQARAPRWMQRAGLEWVFRFMQEPGRLFKRYFTTNLSFIWIFSRELVRSRLMKKAL